MFRELQRACEPSGADDESFQYCVTNSDNILGERGKNDQFGRTKAVIRLQGRLLKTYLKVLYLYLQFFRYLTCVLRKSNKHGARSYC